MSHPVYRLTTSTSRS